MLDILSYKLLEFLNVVVNGGMKNKSIQTGSFAQSYATFANPFSSNLALFSSK